MGHIPNEPAGSILNRKVGGSRTTTMSLGCVGVTKQMPPVTAVLDRNEQNRATLGQPPRTSHVLAAVRQRRRPHLLLVGPPTPCGVPLACHKTGSVTVIWGHP